MIFGTCNPHGIGDVSVKWKDQNKDRINIPISDMFIYALRAFACSHKWYASFTVTAYTSARLLLENHVTPTLFYANN